MADLDGDGDPDVLLTGEDGVAWIENRLDQPNHDFGPSKDVSNVSFAAGPIVTADIDGDGDPDVLVGSLAGDHIVWYENRLDQPTADFAPARTIIPWSDSQYSWLDSVADLDGDGDPDVISRQNPGGLVWFENRLNEPSADFGPPLVISDSIYIWSEFPVDLDGDGDLDVLSTTYNDVVWFENRVNEHAGFATARPIATFANGVSFARAADLDGDGHPDILVASKWDGIAWYANRLRESSHDFGPQQVISALNEDWLSATDIDRDGDLDLVAASFGLSATITLFENPGTDPNKADSDGDGLSDGAEINTHHTDPLAADTDRDGLSDGSEVQAHGTDPTRADTDGDGLSDGAEINTYHTDPLASDTDSDGLADGAEVQTYRTDPRNVDTDGDALRDGFEATYRFDAKTAGEQHQDADGDGLDNLAEQTAGTNPRNADSDGDGLSDGAEVSTFHTDPKITDTDGDGLPDGYEVANGFDPRNAADAHQDPDGDSLDNLGEQGVHTDPRNPDTDGDGWSDGAEVAVHVDPLHSGRYPVVFQWASIGDAGNASDSTGFGGVDYEYRISKFEVTVRQYVPFMNDVADAVDTYELFRVLAAGQITRTGAEGSWRYAAVPGSEDMPIKYVSFYDAIRYVNWLQHGQPVGNQDAATTEDGAYTITSSGIQANSIDVHPGARFALPSENEWYKAAYYDVTSRSYFAYPAGASIPVVCTSPSSLANTANCGHVAGGGDVTAVGSYTAAASPNGTFDQGGNVWEWTDEPSGANRRIRGGGFANAFTALSASGSGATADPQIARSADLGFRVVPEPGGLASLVSGIALLLAIGRRRTKSIR